MVFLESTFARMTLNVLHQEVAETLLFDRADEANDQNIPVELCDLTEAGCLQ